MISRDFDSSNKTTKVYPREDVWKNNEQVVTDKKEISVYHRNTKISDDYKKNLKSEERKEIQSTENCKQNSENKVKTPGSAKIQISNSVKNIGKYSDDDVDLYQLKPSELLKHLLSFPGDSREKIHPTSDPTNVSDVDTNDSCDWRRKKSQEVPLVTKHEENIFGSVIQRNDLNKNSTDNLTSTADVADVISDSERSDSVLKNGIMGDCSDGNGSTRDECTWIEKVLDGTFEEVFYEKFVGCLEKEVDGNSEREIDENLKKNFDKEYFETIFDKNCERNGNLEKQLSEENFERKFETTQEENLNEELKRKFDDNIDDKFIENFEGKFNNEVERNWDDKIFSKRNSVSKESMDFILMEAERNLVIESPNSSHGSENYEYFELQTAVKLSSSCSETLFSLGGKKCDSNEDEAFKKRCESIEGNNNLGKKCGSNEDRAFEIDRKKIGTSEKAIFGISVENDESVENKCTKSNKRCNSAEDEAFGFENISSDEYVDEAMVMVPSGKL